MKLGKRFLIYSIASIAMWIASALILAFGLLFISEGKLIAFFVALIIAVLLGFLGFRIKLKSLTEQFQLNQKKKDTDSNV